MTNTFSLIVIVLLVAIALLILIVYLIGRVHELEIKTSNALSPLSGAQSTHPQTIHHKIFSGLSGQQLWDEFVSLAAGNVDRYGLMQDQDRFFAITELHIRNLLKAGLRSKPRGTDEVPPNPLTISTLRGEFDSYLPPSQSVRLFEIGKSLGKDDEFERDHRHLLLEEARGIIDGISDSIGSHNSLSDNILFAFE